MSTESRPYIGGQAVIEGVMMRGRRHYAVAVRLPSTHEIVIKRGELSAPIYTSAFWKLPFVRGLALIGEQLHLGMASLLWAVSMSASIASSLVPIRLASSQACRMSSAGSRSFAGFAGGYRRNKFSCALR